MYLVSLLVIAFFQANIMGLGDRNIKIIDGQGYKPYPGATDFDSGPVIGEMLNAHFYPAVSAYNLGRYSEAIGNFTYVSKRASYLNGNPRQAEFVSTSFYLRGMIYLYHAQGVGRHSLAKSDFEDAIKWNRNNYMAHLELSRVYSDLGFTDQAVAVVNRMLTLQPPKDIVEEAQAELQKLRGSKD